MVAHDLRNPLTSALSIAHLLHDDAKEKNKEQAEYAQVVVHSLERMNLMIEKILDIKEEKIKPKDPEINTLFQTYLKEVRKLSRIVDTLGG